MTDTLQKALSILTAQAANPLALEELVKAMETCLEGKEYNGSGVDGSGLVGAEIKPEHPLEDYEVTEKDVGSLVYVWDAGDERYPKLDKLLGYSAEAEFYPYVADSSNYRCAKPCLDTIALHFIPFYATENSVAPDDLGEHFAVLWSNGDIELALNAYNNNNNNDWTHKKLDEFWIIGYRPLKFVNPLEEV
jgi:hypothetical protein